MSSTRSGHRAVPATCGEFNAAFAWRIRAGRSRLSKRLGREFGPREMAQMLSRLAGYTVSPDDYRNYENRKKPVVMPADLIFHFAELTHTTVDALLASIHPGGTTVGLAGNIPEEPEEHDSPVRA